MGITYNISIDPGTNNTGICVWSGGKVVQGLQCLKKNPFTVYAKKEEAFLGKLLAIKRALVSLCDSLRSEPGNFGTIKSIAIEEFEGFHTAVDKRAFNKKAMIMCGQIAGMLLSVSDDWAEETIHISKRFVRKNESARLADFLGVTGSEHALDAFYIGVCAGFDKRNMRNG